MYDSTVYIALTNSVLVVKKTVTIKDICKVFCQNQDIRSQIEQIELFTFEEEKKDRKVITILKLIEQISESAPNMTVTSLGANESVVCYEPTKKSTTSFLKLVFLMLIAFFGTAYSIMSYDCDVGARELLNNIYSLYADTSNISQNTFNIVSATVFSTGLLVGMLVFFNHGCRKKESEPTPIQVQMRTYEDEVNNCIVTDKERKKETIDVD